MQISPRTLGTSAIQTATHNFFSRVVFDYTRDKAESSIMRGSRCIAAESSVRIKIFRKIGAEELLLFRFQLVLHERGYYRLQQFSSYGLHNFRAEF